MSLDRVAALCLDRKVRNRYMAGHVGKITAVSAHQVVVGNGIPVIARDAVRPPDRRHKTVIDKVVQGRIYGSKGDARARHADGIVDFCSRWMSG
jgi:hypothetical protein